MHPKLTIQSTDQNESLMKVATIKETIKEYLP